MSTNIETKDQEAVKEPQSESDYTDDEVKKPDNNPEVKKNGTKRDGRKGRRLKRDKNGNLSKAMQNKMLKMAAGRDLSNRQNKLNKLKIKMLQKRLEAYELKEVAEGMFKQVKKETEDSVESTVKPEVKTQTKPVTPQLVRQPLQPIKQPVVNPFEDFF